MEEHFLGSQALPVGVLPQLSQRQDGPGLRRIGLQLLLFALLFPLFWKFAVVTPLMGLVLAGFFAPLHECLHRTAFRSPWLNEGVASICGLFQMLSPVNYRTFHMKHHRQTHLPEDPELLVDPIYRGAWPRRWWAHLWAIGGLRCLWGRGWQWWERWAACLSPFGAVFILM